MGIKNQSDIILLKICTLVIINCRASQEVDQLNLFHFEKEGGIDSFLLNEQIIAIVDKLLEYECLTPSQHQNIRSMQSTLQSSLT